MADTPAARPVPTPTAASEAFWSGGGLGELRINRCQSCRRFFHPPAPVCWRCRSTDVAPEAVSGRASVTAYTRNHQRWTAGFEPPYFVALVALDDESDVRLMTNVVNVAADQMRIGLPVRVQFEERVAPHGGSVWIPMFRPDEQRGNS